MATESGRKGEKIHNKIELPLELNFRRSGLS